MKKSKVQSRKSKVEKSKVAAGAPVIERISLRKVNPAPYNPRADLKPGDAEYEKLRRSIETFGCVQLLVWNRRTGHLVGGHQTLKILQARGDKAAEMSVVDLPPEREKALNVALNRISGFWDPQALEALMADLGGLEDGDELLGMAGFDDGELDRLLAEAQSELEDEAEPTEGADNDAGGDEPPSEEDQQIASSYQVLAECRDEAHQQEVYELLKANDVPCRVLTMY